MPADPNATNVSVPTRPPPAPTPAPTAGGRYVIGEEIARGGMGAVYRATDTALGREVAVKVLQDRFAHDSGTARRFADEARIAAQLQHPGIPPVHDFGMLPDGRPFLAMKLIKGDTLDRLLADRADPSADRGRFVAAFEAVCQAVAFAHARDVIHRDLKPQNIMVGAFGEVQVMDWGLAKVIRAGSTSDGAAPDPGATAPNTEVRPLRDTPDQFTQDGSSMGTPAYMPPEQAVGAVTTVGPWSDVFGLGAVLAVILTGKPPFAAASAGTTRVRAAQGDVADCFARLDASGAEPELVALCKHCLSPKPGDRPADAGEVAAAVAGLRTRAEARARQAELDRATAEATAAEQRKRRRVQSALAVAVVLMVGGAGGIAVWRVDEGGRRRAEALRRENEQREREAGEAVEVERRGRIERDRKQRAADAVAALLDQAQVAMAAEDAPRAAPLLDQAARGAADGAVADHADRLAAYTRDLAMLRALDGVNDFRWTPPDSFFYPSPEKVAERWAAAFAGHGIVPGTTPPAEAAARINSSPIRPALVAGLDGWLARSRSAAVRDLLAATDPDPFRAEVRGRLAAGDAPGLAALVGRAEWAAQPSGLVLAYCDTPAVPVGSARSLLLRLVVVRRTDFGLLAQLGTTYPDNTAEGAGERARWYQAAVALRPRSAVALLNLGIALSDKGDAGGAAVAFREAIRLDPDYAPPHNGLGNALFAQGDAGGAEAAFREAIRLDPGVADPHNGLGIVLRSRGDAAGAVTAHREAIRLRPTDARPHNNLGIALWFKGDAAGAVAAYREALRLDPKAALPHNNLGLVYESRFELDRAEAAYREAVRRDPRVAVAHANIGRVCRKQGRYAEAVAAYRTALAIQPNLAPARDGLDYCLRAQRGEVPTAPPPRAVTR